MIILALSHSSNDHMNLKVLVMVMGIPILCCMSWQALSVQGVPEENLEKLQAGLVAFLKDNKFLTPDMVYAILYTDDEAAGAMTPTIGDHFEESMVWLQWLMFEGEPASALKNLAKINVGQRGVCGAVWGNNDIAYRCQNM